MHERCIKYFKIFQKKEERKHYLNEDKNKTLTRKRREIIQVWSKKTLTSLEFLDQVVHFGVSSSLPVDALFLLGCKHHTQHSVSWQSALYYTTLLSHSTVSAGRQHCTIPHYCHTAQCQLAVSTVLYHTIVTQHSVSWQSALYYTTLLSHSTVSAGSQHSTIPHYCITASGFPPG